MFTQEKKKMFTQDINLEVEESFSIIWLTVVSEAWAY